MLLNSALTATLLAALLLGVAYTGWTIARLRARLAAAEHAASHDPLTGLPNRTAARRLFDTRATAGLATVVALLDLDGFKQVNDTYGHHTGDQLLVAVAERLYGHTARFGGHAARLSGDEFLLILPVHHGDPVEPVATILAQLTAPVRLPGSAITYTPAAAAGVAIFDGVHGTWTSILRRADIACYHAKTSRSPLRVYHPGMTMPTPGFAAQRRGPRVRDLHKGASA